MKAKREIEFNGDELVRRVEAFVRHARGEERLAVRTTTLRRPEREKALRPVEVAAIRRKMRVSQADFARLLNVRRATVANWESGARKPSGAALKLLRIAERHPEALEMKAA